MYRRRLVRSQDSMIAGVCAGIAEYLNIDTALVRIIYVLLTIFSAGFFGILIYIIMWIIMPEY